MSCAQAHWVGSKPILRAMQLKLHKPRMAIGYSLRMCAHVDSTNPGRSNPVFRSKQIPEAEMSNRLILYCPVNLLPLLSSDAPVRNRRVTFDPHLYSPTSDRIVKMEVGGRDFL